MFRILFALLLSVAVVGQSQSPSLSNISGMVTDRYLVVVPNVTIFLRRISSDGNATAQFETKTDSAGAFNFIDVSPGRYEVVMNPEHSEPQTKRITVLKDRSVRMSFGIGNDCNKTSPAGTVVSDEDKATIINLTLADVLSGEQNLLSQDQTEQGVILSTTNIKRRWIKNPVGMTIALMSEGQIRRKANLEGDLMYISFPELKVSGECIALTVVNQWAISTKSRMVPMSGATYDYQYRREAGKWKGRLINGWIS